jgi:hypothetical protein
MTKTEYIAHLRSLGLCKDMAKCMAGQATSLKKVRSATDAVLTFAPWYSTKEGVLFWADFLDDLRWAEEEDERDLKGLK